MLKLEAAFHFPFPHRSSGKLKNRTGAAFIIVIDIKNNTFYLRNDNKSVIVWICNPYSVWITRIFSNSGLCKAFLHPLLLILMEMYCVFCAILRIISIFKYVVFMVNTICAAYFHNIIYYTWHNIYLQVEMFMLHVNDDKSIISISSCGEQRTTMDHSGAGIMYSIFFIHRETQWYS